MPLSSFQEKIARLLANNRTQDNHLAGGSALHRFPNSLRYSQDLDYFQDSDSRVATAFESDKKVLLFNKIKIEVELNQPGYIRCVVSLNKDSTKIEWAQDSSWRFMPAEFDPNIGYVLHPVDLAINKVLALVGRDEARDYLDVHFSCQDILPLGALIWAACGKDPGYSPHSLMELLKRRGKYRREDFDRLHLAKPVNLEVLKENWFARLQSAESFLSKAPAQELGCLYYSQVEQKFFEPQDFETSPDRILHFGMPGGVLPVIKN